MQLIYSHVLVDKLAHGARLGSKAAGDAELNRIGVLIAMGEAAFWIGGIMFGVSPILRSESNALEPRFSEITEAESLGDGLGRGIVVGLCFSHGGRWCCFSGGRSLGGLSWVVAACWNHR